MGVAATPVDPEFARASRTGALLTTIAPVVDGSDSETPAILDPSLDAAPNTPGAERLRTVRWSDGYAFMPDDRTGGHIVDPCAIGTTDPTDTDQSAYVGPVQPFIVEVTDKCSTLGAPPALRQARVMRKLAAHRSCIIAREFWRGDQAVTSAWTGNQYLSQTTGLTQLNNGAVTGFATGLAQLEQAAADACWWSRPVIHCSPYVASLWSGQNMVRGVPAPGGTLMTELGSIVVCDPGYDGSPLTGLHSAHVQWAYVTGVPQIRVGAIRTEMVTDDPSVVDRSTNDRTLRAWCFASVAITPWRAGALLDLHTANSVPGS